MKMRFDSAGNAYDIEEPKTPQTAARLTPARDPFHKGDPAAQHLQNFGDPFAGGFEEVQRRAEKTNPLGPLQPTAEITLPPAEPPTTPEPEKVHPGSTQGLYNAMIKEGESMTDPKARERGAAAAKGILEYGSAQMELGEKGSKEVEAYATATGQDPRKATQMIGTIVARRRVEAENARATGDAFEVEQETKRLKARTRAQEAINREDALAQFGTDGMPVITAADSWAPDLQPTPTYLVDQVFGVGSVNLVAAGAKTGKSTIITDLVASLINAAPWLGHAVPEAHKVLWISPENGLEYDRRLWMRRGIDRNPNLLHADLEKSPIGFAITDPVIRAKWVESIKASGANILVIDGLSAIMSALGLEENSTQEATRFMALLKQLRIEAGLDAIFISHHKNKSGLLRGSGAIWDQASDMATLSRVDDTDNFTLSIAGRNSRIRGERNLRLNTMTGRFEVLTDAELAEAPAAPEKPAKSAPKAPTANTAVESRRAKLERENQLRDELIIAEMCNMTIEYGEGLQCDADLVFDNAKENAKKTHPNLKFSAKARIKIFEELLEHGQVTSGHDEGYYRLNLSDLWVSEIFASKKEAIKDPQND